MPRLVNGQIVDENNPPPTPTTQVISRTGWDIVGVITLFFKTLINPEAEKEAIKEQTARSGSMPNPWQQAQARKKKNNMRGRPLGNVKGIKNVQSVQHRGGSGGG